MMVTIGLDPTLARLGPLVLTWHGLLTALAVLMALTVAGRAARRIGVADEAAASLMLWAVIGGLAGARASYDLDHPERLADGPGAVLAVWEGGIAAYGAFLGGLAAGLVRARRLGLPAWPLLDAAAPAILLGQAVGRLGCLLNGDAWGAPTGAGGGVVSTHPDALLPPSLLGVPTHPDPLSETVWVLGLLGSVTALGPKLGRPGSRFLTIAAGYGAGRLLLGTVRQEPVLLLGLQAAQVIGLVTGTAALAVLLWRLRHAGAGTGRAIEGTVRALPRR